MGGRWWHEKAIKRRKGINVADMLCTSANGMTSFPFKLSRGKLVPLSKLQSLARGSQRSQREGKESFDLGFLAAGSVLLGGCFRPGGSSETIGEGYEGGQRERAGEGRGGAGSSEWYGGRQDRSRKGTGKGKEMEGGIRKERLGDSWRAVVRS
eukprot:756475-Hanusia_phi.AAC.2